MGARFHIHFDAYCCCTGEYIMDTSDDHTPHPQQIIYDGLYHYVFCDRCAQKLFVYLWYSV